MKIGGRKPSVSKSIKGRITGRVKRAAKRNTRPLYGKSGIGYLKDPGKAVYINIYKQSTFGVSDLLDSSPSKGEASWPEASAYDVTTIVCGVICFTGLPLVFPILAGQIGLLPALILVSEIGTAIYFYWSSKTNSKGKDS